MVLGVAGYGNLGKSVVKAALRVEDVEIAAVFTTRDKSRLGDCPIRVESADDATKYIDKIDCMLLCYGASGSLSREIKRYLPAFNTVDSFDNHTAIARHLASADEIARASGKSAVVASGWDPGFLSLIRLYSCAFVPSARVSTFWGEGISQGHTEALKRIGGVRDAIQITVPKPAAIERAKQAHGISSKEGHLRLCYICAEEGAESSIIDSVLSLDGYFKGYDTEIRFVSEGELLKKKERLYHKGRVIAASSESPESLVDFSVEMSNNPDFTASILIASARAAVKINREGRHGAFTLYDIPPKYFASDENILDLC